MWAVLRVDYSHGQTSDHNKQASYYQQEGNQVFTLEQMAGGELEEARRWDDEDERGGTQNPLNT